MSVLTQDPFSRSKRIGDMGRGARLRRPSAAVFVFAFARNVLLVLSHIPHPSIPHVRDAITSTVLPLVEMASVPAHAIGRAADHAIRYGDALTEVERLRLENQRLRQWERRAVQLERDLEALRDHLRVAEEIPGGFVTGRLVADGRGPFMRSALMNVGTEQGVANGLAVVDQDGLLGRVVEVAPRASRLLYLTDVNSRIPVYVGKAGVRAILNGNNTERPELKFLPRPNPVTVGDVVYTSGRGGLFPRGMRVGVVEDTDPVVTVRPEARLGHAEYASILLYAGPRIPAVASDGTLSGMAPSVRRAAAAP